MDGTPRLRSAFPETPDGVRRRPQPRNPSTPSRNVHSRLPPATAFKSKDADSELDPIISTDLVSPATQRFAVLCIYLTLWGWRLWDLWLLVQDDTESLWQFLKWLFIDSAFLFGVPALRIPWLEWSSGLVTLLFFGHAIINGFLMFRIAGPFTLFFEVLVKFFWDSEIAIGENQVKAGKLTDSSDLLLGRQIIHILPEGSAMINPNRKAFCLGAKYHQIEIPIRVNQTQPILIELLRTDLDTGANETITIKKSEAKSLLNTARRSQGWPDPSEPLLLHYTVKKTGRYTIRKVIDETELAVRPRAAELIVVACPKASIEEVVANKCKSDLSDIAFEVEGSPPLKLRYRKIVNDQKTSSSLQSIQPDGFAGPLLRSEQAPGTLTRIGDVSWAKPQKVRVPVGELMLQPGRWEYIIDDVEDAFGNRVSFADQIDEDGLPKSKNSGVQRAFTVHDRPQVSLWTSREKGKEGCDLQSALQIPDGGERELPIKFGTPLKGKALDAAHNIKVKFIPEEALESNGEHNEVKAEILEFTLKPNAAYKVSKSGLYTLHSVSTDFCEGEVVEPSACLVQHPQRPQLNVITDNITDKCARMPIGLTIDLEFSGTPPFKLQYSIAESKAKTPEFKWIHSQNRRYRLELKPEHAGQYVYRFLHFEDHHYIQSVDNVFRQDVKPSASAKFNPKGSTSHMCKGAQAEYPVQLTGEPPFALVYELVSGGKRKRETIKGIKESSYLIQTDSLAGGDYELSLVSVSDSRDCLEAVNDVRTFTVRRQTPKAAFGLMEGKHAVQRVEGSTVELPLRLTGDGPWTLAVENTDDSNGPNVVRYNSPNAVLSVVKQGRYEIQSVQDSICTGEVDQMAKAFTLSWIPRPQLFISESPKTKISAATHIREEVCEGDEDYIEMAFSGAPPFNLTFEEKAAPEAGRGYTRSRSLPAALGVASIQLETSKAGQYEYKFTKLTDANYQHYAKRFSPILLQQKVNSRPTARFKNPGRTYAYCTVEGHSEEFIPVVLSGQPPFYLEVEMKQSGNNKPELISISNIEKENYELRIPHRLRQQGHAHVTIRKVRDSRGCQSKSENPQLAPRIQISVHDPPIIIPSESKEHYCVGERLSFRLGGSPPFNIFYSWKGKERKASSGAIFNRIAEEAGSFIITGVSDAASECRALVDDVTKTIHALPRAKIARGKDLSTDIHEGGEVEMTFELVGEPPFEFTYTRAELGRRGGDAGGAVLETKTERTDGHSFRVMASEEGIYEIISVRDRWCVASKPGGKGKAGSGQKLLVQ